jgi:anti-sigma factor RsiW
MTTPTFCDEVLEVIEPIAAGDAAPDDRVAAHLASCEWCAGALDRARRLDRLLRERPAPSPPAQFTSRTLTRIRRERWRREQTFDLGFNLALAALVLAVVVAGWAFADVLGLSRAGAEAVAAAWRGIEPRLGSSIPLYAGAAALLGGALGLWWWAERDAAL